MNLYFVGGEDIDFNAGATAALTATTAGAFRTGWARGVIKANGLNLICKSNPFLGGAVTSCWFSFQVGMNASSGVNLRIAGLIASATASSGLWIGQGSTSTKIGLYKYDGTTLTSLAQSTADIWIANTVVLARIDVQVISYGASATVNVYANGAAIISYTGDVTVSGVTNLDAVAIGNAYTNSMGISEVVVADSDTRALQGVQTLALTGAGTTNGWTNNTFSNINGFTFSDTNPASVNTTGTDQEYNVTDPTPTVFSVVGVKISARMAKSASPTPTQVKLGYNSGGSVAFGTGATKALTTSYATYEQIDQLNPVTSAAFTSSELTALQLDLQSA